MGRAETPEATGRPQATQRERGVTDAGATPDSPARHRPSPRPRAPLHRNDPQRGQPGPVSEVRHEWTRGLSRSRRPRARPPAADRKGSSSASPLLIESFCGTGPRGHPHRPGPGGQDAGTAGLSTFATQKWKTEERTHPKIKKKKKKTETKKKRRTHTRRYTKQKNRPDPQPSPQEQVRLKGGFCTRPPADTTGDPKDPATSSPLPSSGNDRVYGPDSPGHRCLSPSLFFPLFSSPV